jgi:hypothetical protein
VGVARREVAVGGLVGDGRRGVMAGVISTLVSTDPQPVKRRSETTRI